MAASVFNYLKHNSWICSLSVDKVILLWGYDSGKEKIMDMLTDNNYMTVPIEPKTTDTEIQIGINKYKPYMIMNFPEHDGDQSEHLEVQTKFLKLTGFAVVCFVCEMSDEYDVMVEKMVRAKNLFRRYSDNVFLILTNCDGYTMIQKADAVNVIANHLKFPLFRCVDSTITPKLLSSWIYRNVRHVSPIKEGEVVFDIVIPKSPSKEEHINASKLLNYECAVCMEYTERTRVLLPCKHTQYCLNCIDKLQGICYLCRKDIKEIMEIF